LKPPEFGGIPFPRKGLWRVNLGDLTMNRGFFFDFFNIRRDLVEFRTISPLVDL
jgi:hypothetical protein